MDEWSMAGRARNSSSLRWLPPPRSEGLRLLRDPQENRAAGEMRAVFANVNPHGYSWSFGRTDGTARARIRASKGGTTIASVPACL